MIPIASNYTWGANEVSVRKKDNSTSAYVNYNIYLFTTKRML